VGGFGEKAKLKKNFKYRKAGRESRGRERVRKGIEAKETIGKTQGEGIQERNPWRGGAPREKQKMAFLRTTKKCRAIEEGGRGRGGRQKDLGWGDKKKKKEDTLGKEKKPEKAAFDDRRDLKGEDSLGDKRGRSEPQFGRIRKRPPRISKKKAVALVLKIERKAASDSNASQKPDKKGTKNRESENYKQIFRWE